MDVYEAIRARRTTRTFSARMIEDAVLERVLDAGLRAPSNDHMRRWEFVLIDDRNLRARLVGDMSQGRSTDEAAAVVEAMGLGDEAARGMYRDAIPKQARMLLDCARLVVPCFRQKSPLSEARGLQDLNGLASIWCCVENVLVAAASEGIQGVTRIPSDDELARLRNLLAIPDDYAIACWLALGYPDEEDGGRIVQHFPDVRDRIRTNGWLVG